MKYIKKFSTVLCAAAIGLVTLTGCEGGDILSINSPDWLSDRIDSIAKANTTVPDVLENMQEDVYTFGNTDFSSTFWSAFSKYYVIPENTKWNAVFDLNINSDEKTVYYKNFALVISNDEDRGAANYKEYGAIRYDATGDTATYNSQWGSAYYKLPFKFTSSDLLLSPTDNIDKNIQKLGGRCTLTVDRSRPDTFYVKMYNGVVTKTYTQPYSIGNLNADASNKNIRCFIAPEGSFVNFQQSNVEPIGGYTSAADKQPVSITLNNVPEKVDLGSVVSGLSGVTATVTFEEGVQTEVNFSDLICGIAPDTTSTGEKYLVASYAKTFKGNDATKAVQAPTAKFKVVGVITGLNVTSKPAVTNYEAYVANGVPTQAWGFIPDGLVVQAVYNDGQTATLDNSELTFGTISQTEGTQQVKITAPNGVYTTVPVNVAKVTNVKKVTPSPEVLGNADCSTGWWGAHLDNDIKVESGATVAVEFTNISSGEGNWNNWVAVLRGATKNEYAVVRADNYGWGAGYADNANLVNKTSALNWASWLAEMNGSNVIVYVTNNGNGTADIYATVKGTKGTLSTQIYTGIKVTAGDLYLDFTVDSSCLKFK